MTELACYLLMFSQADWQRLLGASADVEDFLTNVWEKAQSFEGDDPVAWVDSQVQTFKA